MHDNRKTHSDLISTNCGLQYTPEKRVNHVEAQYNLQCIRELDTAARCMNDLGVLSATPGYKRSSVFIRCDTYLAKKDFIVQSSTIHTYDKKKESAF
jgi:hypothetical protein